MMKRIFLVLAVLPAPLWFVSAQDARDDGAAAQASPPTVEKPVETPAADVPAKDKKAEKEKSGFAWPSFMTGENATVNTGFRRQRIFELGFIGLNAGVSNSWFSIGELVNVAGSFAPGASGGDSGGINDFLSRGALNLELGLFSRPLGMRIRMENLFTLDFSSSVEVNLRLATSKGTINSLKTLSELGNSTNPADIAARLSKLNGEAVVGGSAFGAVSIGAEKKFLNDRLWLRAAPSVFVPIFYLHRTKFSLRGTTTAPDSNGVKWYELTTGGAQTMTAYLTSPESIAMGLDTSLEGRYALWSILDVGASIENIPLLNAKMSQGKSYLFDLNFKIPDHNDFMANLSHMTSDEIANYQNGVHLENKFEEKNSISGSKNVFRPVRFDFYGIVKPFQSKFLLVRPELGFSLNTAAAESTFNWGLQGQLNFPIIASLALGIREFEEVWSNSLTVILDFRFIELELGLALRGTDFVSSWTAHGLGAVIGLRAGF